MALKRVPWWTRIAGKIVLSRLPIPYAFWRKFGLFRHGEMNRPEQAARTFDKYYQRALQCQALPAGFRSLELGPGDSILSGLVARAYGASQAWLVDAGAFADSDVAGCLQVAALLEQQGRALPDLSGANSLAEVLDRASVHYLTDGTNSLAHIPSGSIDFFWSQVVLEHVPRHEFPVFLRELRRVVSDNAIGIHSIDFRDHIGGDLNSLRFTEKTWEGALFRNSGFYTNRLRPREMLAMFKDAGFSVEVTGETRWPVMPIKRTRLAPEFRTMPDEDFLVAEIDVVLRPA